MYKTDYINGKAITKLFYGVTPVRVPDDVSEGNDVAVYNIQLLYAGWIEAVSSSSDNNKKRIWAVGSKMGIEGSYSPYSIQNANGNGATGKTNMTATAIVPKGTTDIADDGSADVDNEDEIKDAIKAKGNFASILSGSSITFEVKKEDDKENKPQDNGKGDVPAS